MKKITLAAVLAVTLSTGVSFANNLAGVRGKSISIGKIWKQTQNFLYQLQESKRTRSWLVKKVQSSGNIKPDTELILRSGCNSALRRQLNKRFKKQGLSFGFCFLPSNPIVGDIFTAIVIEYDNAGWDIPKR